MDRKRFSLGRVRLAALFLAVAVSAAVSTTMTGCGGADQTTGTMAEPDPQAAKRVDDMTNFYKSNPLPKPGGRR